RLRFRTLADLFAALALKRRLDRKIRPPRPQSKSAQTRRTAMNLSFFDGYKTYVVAAAMLLAAISQLLGVDLPSFEGQSAGHLLMEGLAIIFLRKGIKASAS
ncbi:MAG: hypothetical protein ACYC0C_18255, partial [Devosia sp.]